MGCETLFGNVIHPFTTNLDFNPLSVVTHQSDVQCLITISFRMANPIAQTVRVGFVYLGDRNVDIETVIELFFLIAWFEDDSNSQQVKYFFERNMFGLHLVPDGID